MVLAAGGALRVTIRRCGHSQVVGETTVTIRQGVIADLDAVAGFNRKQTRQVLGRKLGDGDIGLAEVGGGLAGYLRLEWLWSKVPYSGMIAVRPELQRRGIGKALLASLCDYLRGQGHRLVLSSSQCDEPDAQAWHRHMGFVECGALGGSNDGGIGEVFFRKEIGGP